MRKGGRYHLKGEPSAKIVQPKSPHFSGNLYVLINEYSHSASGGFSGGLAEYNRVIFIVAETGGNPHQNVAGESIVLHLPNSGIRVVIPILKYVINNSKGTWNRGQIPDREILPTIEDVLKGKDRVMEFTRQLIQSKANNN